MLRIEIPGYEPLNLQHLVCDFNGTLAVDGALVEGVVPRLVRLGERLRSHIVTAGTHGNLGAAQDELRAACTAANIRGVAWH